MKLKDLLTFVFLGVVLIILGSFFISKVGRGGEPRRAEVEVIQTISPVFNEAARSTILGQDQKNKTTQYSAPANLTGGFGNKNPFGQ